MTPPTIYRLLLLLTLSVVPPLWAQEDRADASGEPVRLSWALREGERLTYSVSIISTSQGPAQITQEVHVVLSVFVLRDGAALVEARVEALSGGVDGRSASSEELESQRQRLQFRTVLTPEGFDPRRALPRIQRDLLGMWFPLPAQPLRVGESCPALSLNPLHLAPDKIEAGDSSLELVALERAEEALLARLRLVSASSTAVREPEDELLAAVTGELLFDLTAGRQVRHSLTTTSALTTSTTEVLGTENQLVVQLDAVGEVGKADRASKTKLLDELLR